MEIKSRFDHFNINVTDLERSIAFYEKALGLKEHHRKEAADGSFILVYLTDNTTGFLLELTWLRDHTEAYELGENESHLCFRVAGDYDITKKWTAYALRILPWGSISSMIRMTTGLKYYRNDFKTNNDER